MHDASKEKPTLEGDLAGQISYCFLDVHRLIVTCPFP